MSKQDREYTRNNTDYETDDAMKYKRRRHKEDEFSDCDEEEDISVFKVSFAPQKPDPKSPN